MSSPDINGGGNSDAAATSSFAHTVMNVSTRFADKYISRSGHTHELLAVLAALAVAWLWMRVLYSFVRRFFAPSDDPLAWLECLARSPHRSLILPPDCAAPAVKSGNRAVRLAQGVKQVVVRRFRPNVLNGNVLVPGALPASCTPLVCFVNKKSGGNQGLQTLASLRQLLNPLQVFDVHQCDSVAVLRAFAVLPRLRVLVAGGDGTVARVIEASLNLDADLRPPIAILPLGTGNDLARTLGWGGTADMDNLAASLVDVCNAVPQVAPPAAQLSCVLRQGARRVTPFCAADAGSLAVYCNPFLRCCSRRQDRAEEGVHELLRHRRGCHDCDEVRPGTEEQVMHTLPCTPKFHALCDAWAAPSTLTTSCATRFGTLSSAGRQ